jgi:hypothetical protein
VGIEEVRLEKAGTEWAEDYTIFCREGNEDDQLGTDFLYIRESYQQLGEWSFCSDTILCIILRGRWCNIIVLNVHAVWEDKRDDIKDCFYEDLGHVFDQFPSCDMNILVGDFSAKVGREDIFKPAVVNESSHKISNDNGSRVVNFST